MARTDLEFDVTALDRASRTFARMADAVDRFERRLERLDGKTVTAEVKVKTDKAEREVGRFARDMQKRLGSALESLPDLQLGMDASEAQRELAQIRGEMAVLDDKRIGVDISAEDAHRELGVLERRLNELSRSTADVQVRADAGAAAAQLAAINSAVDKLDGRTARVRVNVDNSLSDSLIKVAQLGRALSALALPAAALAAAPQLASLGGAAVSAAGGLGLLPAVGFAAAAGIGALAVGFAHVSDALGDTSTPAKLKKVNEAIASLSPNARAAVQEIRALGPAWTSIRLDTQQALFEGLAESVSRLATRYLPILRTAFVGISGSVNDAAQQFVNFATSSQTLDDTRLGLGNIQQAASLLAPSLTNISQITRDIGVVGSEFLPDLASGFTGATASAAAFVAQARESGQLADWIQRGIDTLAQLGRIAADVGGILGSIFDAARTAGADFLGSVERITSGVRAFLDSTQGQNALVDFFSEVRRTVDNLMPGLKALGTAVVDVVQSLSNAGVFSGAAAALSSIAQAAAPVLTALGSLASAVLPPLLGALQALAPILGPLAVGFLAVATAVKAWGAISKIVTGVQAAVVSAGTGLAGFSQKLGASEAGASRVATAFSKVGAALPIIGVALVGIGIAYDQLSSKADTAAASVISGSQTMQQAIQTEAAQVTKQAAIWGALNLVRDQAGQKAEIMATAEGNVTAEYAKQYAQLGLLEQKQADVARAKAEYSAALRDFGQGSAEAEAAATKLAAANDELASAQSDAERAARSHTEALVDQGNQMRSQIDAGFAYEAAVKATAEAHKAAEQALASGGAASEKYKTAVTDLARAMDDQAAAAQKVAEAANAQADPAKRAAAGQTAWSNEILRTASASGVGRDALAALTANMGQAGLDALSAQARLSGLRTEIVTLPDGRKVTIIAQADRAKFDQMLTDMAAAERDGLVLRIDGDVDPVTGKITQAVTLANGQTGTISVDANVDPATGKINGSVTLANGQTGTITIDGNAVPVNGKIQASVTYADGSTGMITVDANAVPANAKITQVVTFADGSVGTITIDGNPIPVNGKITAAVQFADGSVGTVVLDGNPDPATGKINGVVTHANGTTGTVTVNANTAAANAAIDYAARPRTMTITATTIYGGSTGAASAARKAQGGIVSAMRDGGVVGMAGGGVRGRRTTHMRGGLAQVVAPNTWRIIGDRIVDDEAYIPINRSPRSQAILRSTAQSMGWDLIPHGAARMASGGTAGAVQAFGDRLRAGTGTLDARIRSLVQSALSIPPTAGTAGGRVELGPLLAELRKLQASVLRSAAPSNGQVVDELRGVRSAVLALASSSAGATAYGARLATELGEQWRG